MCGRMCVREVCECGREKGARKGMRSHAQPHAPAATPPARTPTLLPRRRQVRTGGGVACGARLGLRWGKLSQRRTCISPLLDGSLAHCLRLLHGAAACECGVIALVRASIGACQERVRARACA